LRSRAQVAEQAKVLAGKSPLSVIDGLLAATAMEHNLTLVTRNTKDVAFADVAVFNPSTS
jgi:predicted nucleic acid-binding protein